MLPTPSSLGLDLSVLALRNIRQTIRKRCHLKAEFDGYLQQTQSTKMNKFITPYEQQTEHNRAERPNANKVVSYLPEFGVSCASASASSTDEDVPDESSAILLGNRRSRSNFGR